MNTEKIFEELKKMGCQLDNAMTRFLDDKEFYITCLEQVVDEPCYDTLKATLESKDVNAAFDAAHTLKGVIANMELTPLYEIIVQIVEPLRAGSCEGLLPLYDQLVEKNNEIKKILAEV